RPGRTLVERDNWLVGREKYLAAQKLVDSGAPLKTTPLIFHSEPMMTAINYARALESDGVFDDKARDGWELATEEMRRFAVRQIPTSWDVPIRLGLREAELARAERLAKQLEELLPGKFSEMESDRENALSKEQKSALQVPPLDRTEQEQQLVAAAQREMKVTWRLVAQNADPEVRAKAKRLAEEYVEATETADIIDRYRDIVNFDYWRATCEMSVTDLALQAREATWRAEKDYEEARLQPAKQAFEEAFKAWRKVLDDSDVLRKDAMTQEDIIEIIDTYRELLEQLDEPFPQPFILDDVLNGK
ncbi:MAG: hypothetical protein KAT44_13480, partial [Pirellulales bacterium]|nr:hypothetical protein [Pirellulales bacterium]